MKRFSLFIGLSAMILLFFSCSKNKDYVEYIPDDSTFVLLLNPKSLATKGNLNQLEKYEFFKDFEKDYLASAPELKALWTSIQSNPTDAGVDLISPIYVMGQKIDQRNMFALLVNMKDKTVFEKNLKTVFKNLSNKQITFEKRDGYTFIKNQDRPFIAWNKHHLLYLAAEYGTPSTAYTHYFKHITESSTPLANTDSFKDFMTKSQDINFWYTGQFIQDLTKSKRPDSSAIDLTKSSWSNYLSFTTDGLTYIQKFHPDAATKKQLQTKGFWKNRVNSEVFAFFPAQSFAYIGFAVHPENARYIWEDQPFVARIFSDYSIDIKQLSQSFEGEALFSVFDFEMIDVFNKNDFFGKKEQLLKKVAVPQFALAGRMKNDNFYKSILTTYAEQLQPSGTGYALRMSPTLSLWITYQNNILYLTNNQLVMSRFQNQEVATDNFLKSKNAFNANNPLFSYINLDVATYSPEIQQFIYHQIPFGETVQMQTILKNFRYAEYRVADQYTKNGKLYFKEQNKNSLEILLGITDGVYQILTQPQQTHIQFDED